MKKKAFWLVIFLLTTVSTYFYVSSQKKDNAETENISVDRLKVLTIEAQDFDSLIMDVANDKDFFKKNNLEVEWEKVVKGASTALIAGEADVSFAGVSRAAMAYSEGAEVKLLASPLKMVFDSVSRYPKEEADKIKNVGVSILTGDPVISVSKALKYYGADLSKIEFVAVSGDVAKKELFERGEIDFTEYQSAMNLEGDNTYYFSSEEYMAEETPIQGIKVTDKVLNEKAAALEKFVKAIYQASRYIADNPEETKNFMREKYDFDEKYLEYLYQSVYLGIINVEYVPKEEDIQKLFDDIAEILKVDMNKTAAGFIYSEFAERAIAE